VLTSSSLSGGLAVWGSPKDWAIVFGSIGQDVDCGFRSRRRAGHGRRDMNVLGMRTGRGRYEGRRSVPPGRHSLAPRSAATSLKCSLLGLLYEAPKQQRSRRSTKAASSAAVTEVHSIVILRQLWRRAGGGRKIVRMARWSDVVVITFVVADVRSSVPRRAKITSMQCESNVGPEIGS
jgi:hypothetical protein